MATERRIYRFGPFRLDEEKRFLCRGDDPTPLSLTPRALQGLLLLVAHAGRLIAKEELQASIWGPQNTNVDDDDVYQVATEIRRHLGRQKNGQPYIVTKSGSGYLFVATVMCTNETAPDGQSPNGQPSNGQAPGGPRIQTVTTPAPVDTKIILEPLHALMEARRLLETLKLESVRRAREILIALVEHDPQWVAARIALANACILEYQATRADATPNRAALREAEENARIACDLAPLSAHAWSTLAVVLYCKGDRRDAICAAQKAVQLEPEECEHWLRLAFVSCGKVRLRAATQALSLVPGLPLAHWFAATVYVPRGAFDLALRHVDAGCAAIDDQNCEGYLPALGLFLLRARILAARGGSRGSLKAARKDLDRELALALQQAGRIYERECLANTWYTIGALALRDGSRDDARAAFKEARVLVPSHALAAVGLDFTGKKPDRAEGTSRQKPVRAKGRQGARELSIDDAVVEAAALVLRDKDDAAAEICAKTLKRSEPDSSGWDLPVEPLLNIGAHSKAWAHVLRLLRTRAV